MRKIIPINNNWFFTDNEQTVEINLPHTNKILPYNGFDEREYQFHSLYKKTLRIPESYREMKILIHFEGVMAACKIKLNGKMAGEHLGGYTAFNIDVTEFVQFGKDNLITVDVDSTEREDIPPFGKVIDYMTYGGIYREVSLIVVNPVHMENVFIQTENELLREKGLKTTVFINNESGITGKRTLSISLADGDKNIKTAITEIELQTEPFSIEVHLDKLKDLIIWELESPKLYTINVELSQGDLLLDSLKAQFGFRTAEFKPDGFYLNGKKIKIRGLNRHQSYPYSGYAMPWRAQKRDADILKFDLGVNLVRTAHYPQSRHFLDRCDEIGLLVFEEIPGWQHIGNNEWQDNACNMVEEMITTDWNRPSIILWGVRINESEDNHDFYVRTNDIARNLDKTRQTGGVRYIEKSEFLEDVYTMNDFVHAGGTEILRSGKKVTGKRHHPYLVTEHNGHMFPTKRFDQEERLQEHALRHLKVLNRALGDKHISGAIGWCAFDYNTHREFGSGDRVCYHGVSDMFRIPKYAAAVYASQINPESKIILETASLFSKGERDAARILPIYVYTNCDYIKLYKNGREIGDFYPASSEFPHVDHAPVVIRDLVGKQLEDSQFSPRDQKRVKKLMSFVMINGEEKLKWFHYLEMGILMKKYKMQFSDMVDLFMKFTSGWGESEDLFQITGIHRGNEVVKKTYGSGYASKLTIESDDIELQSGDWDTTRVEFRIEDQYGNIMPFINEYIEFEINGPGEIIGPVRTALAGGVISTWIKTIGEKGTITIKGHSSRFSSEEIKISVN